jgi:hypothetical protein
MKKKKKKERWGQNGIKKKWDYKYPIPSLSHGCLDNIKKGGISYFSFIKHKSKHIN